MKQKSWKEQINTIRKELFPNSPEITPVIQVTGQLTGESAKSTFSVGRDTVLKWLNDKQDIDLPKKAWKGKSFELDLTRSRPVVVDALNKQLWALRYDNPDRNIPGRIWRTEVVILIVDDDAQIGIRLTAISHQKDKTLSLSIPGVVNDLCESPGLRDYGELLAGKVTEIKTQKQVNKIITLIENSQRTRPVYVGPTKSLSLQEFKSLATLTTGIAHVARIHPKMMAVWVETIGEYFSLQEKALWAFRPGFDMHSPNHYDHPSFTPRQIRENYKDNRVFIENLVSWAMRNSIAPIRLQSMPSFASVRSMITSKKSNDLKTKVDKAIADSTNANELVNLLMDQNSALSKENLTLKEETEEALNMASRHEVDANSAREAVKEERAKYHALQQHTEHLKTLAESQAEITTLEFPEDLSVLNSWVNKHFAEFLVMLPRAVKGAKKSKFSDTELICKCLIILANQYVPMKRGELSKQQCDLACKELGVEITPTGDEGTLGQWPDEYYVHYGGQRIFLKMHLKKGTGSDPANCLRIYFFWDKQSKQVVIGSMPEHLPNTKA